jgi:hypothetical protein
MNFRLDIPLTPSPEQAARLLALQAAFAQVCNALAPLVRQTRSWHRVTLHHLAYRSLREQFPQIGSQMVCNAIYSVSRHCRSLFQSSASPFHLSKLGDRPLPLLQFSDSCPVYFDRHTLSLKDGVLSLYTLDGRMRFALKLDPHDEARFHQLKLREVVLNRQLAKPAAGQKPDPRRPRFVLSFTLTDPNADEGADSETDAQLNIHTGAAALIDATAQANVSQRSVDAVLSADYLPIPPYLKLEELHDPA